MNNQVPGDAAPISNAISYPQEKRKPGQLANEIIFWIMEYPEISLGELAELLCCGYQNIRKVYREIESNSKFYAAVDGHDLELLSTLLDKRDNSKKLTRHVKKPWRGKADWPAWKVATKTDVSEKDTYYFSEKIKQRLTKDDIFAIRTGGG